jgi:hypothetical protein
MEAIGFVKNFRNGKGGEQAEITQEESNGIQQQLRETNNRIYQESLNDAEKMLGKYIMPYSNPIKEIQKIADKLFEKRAIHSLTAYQGFLKAKIQKLRNNGINGNGVD